MNAEFVGNSLIAELLSDPARFKREGRAYQLLEEYYSGLPVETLRPLLRHDDAMVRHAALWVTAELGQQACVLLDDAIPHIKSEDRFQSYHALEIVAVCAVGAQVERFIRIVAGLESGDSVIRGLAMRLMARADDSQLQAGAAAADDGGVGVDAHVRGLKLLAAIEAADPVEVQRFLVSDNEMDRCYGAIAAKRLCNRHPELLKLAETVPDATMRKFFSDTA